jgi:2-polyprenyl-3-methyl-5-hydroxy-6-metoxy-1,4-benzoquinol methylase
VYVVVLDGGGLISYRHADGRFVHTLNTPEGFGRKLDQLGIRLEAPAADRDVPARWLVDHAGLLPRRLAGRDAPRALDVACGSGRHARWLATHGFQTTALDRDAQTIDQLNDDVRHLRLGIEA